MSLATRKTITKKLHPICVWLSFTMYLRWKETLHLKHLSFVFFLWLLRCTWINTYLFQNCITYNRKHPIMCNFTVETCRSGGVSSPLSPSIVCPLTSYSLCCQPSSLRWRRFPPPSGRWSPCCSPTPARWVRTWQPVVLYQRSAESETELDQAGLPIRVISSPQII